MKALFVCSGNSSNFLISPFIAVQANSLKAIGIDVAYFVIKGKGVRGYLSNVRKLKSHLQENSYDLIHAHYSLSALIALLSRPGIPVVASYMGNDAFGEFDQKGRFKLSSLPYLLLAIAIQPFISHIISKSQSTSKHIYFTRHSIIPNGVDLAVFKPFDRLEANEHDLKHVLFLGDLTDLNKNYALLEKAVSEIGDIKLTIVAPYPVNHTEIPAYYNQADVFVLCSIVEGSPNVVKEAMACNCPIVATNVGDTKWLLGDLQGHYLTTQNAHDLADKIRLALAFNQRTKGRDRLISLGLDTETVARKIETIYNDVLSQR